MGSAGKGTIDPRSGYYGAGGIETIDVIRAKLTDEQFEGYLLANIIKYTTRCNHKGSMTRDIEKADVYSTLLTKHRRDRERDEVADIDARGRVPDAAEETWG